MSKAPPDGSRNGLMRSKPLLSILREELGREGLGRVVCWGLVAEVTLRIVPP